MKKITLALVALLFMISCNQQAQKEESKNEDVTVKTDDNESKEDSNNEPKSDEAVLEAPCKEVDVLSFDGDNEKNSEHHEIEVKLGKGYTLYETESRYSAGPGDWYCDKFEFKKDQQTIYTQKEDGDHFYPVRSRKHFEEIPRVATKGNKTAFIHETVLMPNDVFYRALLFENDKFVKVVNVNKTILSNQEELNQLFEKF